MNPPLEKFGLLQKSNRVTFPLTWTRRIGEACDTAQNSLFAKQPVPPVTLIVRFDTERQKLSSAVQLPLMHWLTRVDRAVDDDTAGIAARGPRRWCNSRP